ncbi:hypothetical protein [Nannocystis radixulma]|uniref:Uncharacterized protein n=1 Tax=Nannocystis radixulma TaxID=2995305 RepID=A0ABT5BJA2_9BACT|nr:hypothetical protein [Nannocystis radixulma]MDC0674235.1 hypothetical protein [Nannocystis radixulma]
MFAGSSEPSRVDALVDESERGAKEAMARWEQAEIEAKKAEEAAAAAIDAAKQYEVRAKAADAELEQYTAVLAEARDVGDGCKATRERLVEIHDFLLEYVSEPRRDAAIAGLEPCRKAAAKPKKADVERENAAMRKDVAATLEQQFDAAFPDERGHLVATVKGEVLDVDMPTFSGWDAERSQKEVDGWCDKVPNFTSIALRNRSGSFKCKVKEPPKEYAARMLRAAKLDEPWTSPPGGQKPIPAPQGEAERAEMERLIGEMKTTGDAMEEAHIRLDGAKERAENAIAHFEEMVKEASR